MVGKIADNKQFITLNYFVVWLYKSIHIIRFDILLPSAKMTNYTKRAIKGVSIVLVISLLAALLGYLVRVLLARFLTVEDFGLFYAVFSFLGLLGVFKSLGQEQAIVKFIPEFLHTKRNDLVKSSILYTTATIFITNIIVIASIYLLSSYLSANFFHSPKANIVLKLMAIAFFIDSFVLSLKSIFQGFQEMGYYGGIDLLRMILISAIILIGLKSHYGILLPVYAYILTPLVLLITFSFMFVKRIFPEFIKSKFILDIEVLKKLFRYGFFVMTTSTGLIILGYTDTIVLTYFSGLKSVALYNIAFPTANALSYFPKAIVGILVPLTAELWIRNRKEMICTGIELLYKYSIMIIVPAVFFILSLTDLIIIILFGENYLPASTALKILSVGLIFTVLYAINFAFFSGIGKPEINSKIVYTAAFFNLIFNLILVPLTGIVGAALTTTTSLFMMMIIGLIKIRKFVKIKFPIKIWMKTLVAGIVMIFAILLLKTVLPFSILLKTAVIFAVSGIVYVALLFLLRAVKINELRDLYYRLVK